MERCAYAMDIGRRFVWLIGVAALVVVLGAATSLAQSVTDDGAGTITIVGTAGSDTIVVADDGVNIDIAINGNSVTWADYDLTANVTDIVISGFGGNDTITCLTLPAGVSCDIDGGAGNDVIAGGAGNDMLDGGDGVDTVSYADVTTNVSASLTTGGAIGVGIGIDTLAGFENIIGGSGNDLLTGDAGANALAGGDGDDVLNGRGGDDIINGGNGDDVADYRDGAAVSVNVDLVGGIVQDGERDGYADIDRVGLRTCCCPLDCRRGSGSNDRGGRQHRVVGCRQWRQTTSDVLLGA